MKLRGIILLVLLAGCSMSTPVPVSSLGGLNPPLLPDAYNIQAEEPTSYTYIMGFSYNSHVSAGEAEQQLKQAMADAGWQYAKGSDWSYRFPSTGESGYNTISCFSKGEDKLELTVHEETSPKSAEIKVIVNSIRPTVEDNLLCRY
jgi:hypothetical protein